MLLFTSVALEPAVWKIMGNTIMPIGNFMSMAFLSQFQIGNAPLSASSTSPLSVTDYNFAKLFGIKRRAMWYIVVSSMEFSPNDPVADSMFCSAIRRSHALRQVCTTPSHRVSSIRKQYSPPHNHHITSRIRRISVSG